MLIPCTQPVIYLQVTEIVKEEEKLTILAKQFMERVDENNDKKPLVLQWVWVQDSESLFCKTHYFLMKF